MARAGLEAIVRQIRNAAGAQVLSERSDRELLHDFSRDKNHAAFTALVKRHGPMVQAVCRRVLHHEQDAEDAFQATFLILARNANSIRNAASLGSWLHGVAYHTAMKAKMRAARRRQREARALPPRAPNPAWEAAWREVQAILDEEIRRLPEKYRATFVLCCLEGYGRADAARELGLKEGTVWSRMAEARRRLQRRLSRRGIALPAVLAAAAVSQHAGGAVPPLLREITVRAALQYASGTSANTAGSAAVVALAKEATATFLTVNAKALVLVLVVAGAVTGGAAALARQTQTNAAVPQAAPTRPLATREAAQPSRDVVKPVRADAYGDPLPEGVRMRMGSSRLQQGGLLDCLAYSPDGKMIVSSAYATGINVWDAGSGKRLHHFDLPKDWFLQFAFSGDGATLTCLAGRETVECRLLHVATGAELRRTPLSGATGSRGLAVAPGGGLVAVAHDDNSIRLYDATRDKQTLRIPFRGPAVQQIAFSPDARAVALADVTDTLSVHDTVTGKVIATLKRPNVEFCRAAFSPDGRWLATGSRGSAKDAEAVSIWDLSTGKERHRLKGPHSWGCCPAFSPDGRLLATGDFQGRLTVWDVATGIAVRAVHISTTLLASAAFSPDGKTIAAATYHWDHAMRRGHRPGTSGFGASNLRSRWPPIH
ncbi:MAG TPA: sigma-70 family RNA polymerase sigma factor [Gemmataceae bacterium]|nr:sigma-70 family RNA polymerase sigma factor [Gemmataceae bacterium]